MRRIKTIEEKLNELPSGRYLDVSRFERETQRGVRTLRKLPTRGKNKGIADIVKKNKLPIYSTNLEKFNEAVSGLSQDKQDLHKNDIKQVIDYFEEREISDERYDPEALEEHERVDIFDFDRYPEDRKLLSTYFSGLELYLRLASWIEYKYLYMKNDKKYVKSLDQKIESSQDKRQLLEELTGSFVGHNMLTKWYLHFNKKAATIDNVDKVYDKYQHHLGELFYRLYRTYVDPEAIRETLWFEDE